MTDIIVALITGMLALAGVVITNSAANKKMQTSVTAKIEKAQAITDTNVKELTREVRKHNNFAERVPVIEEQIKAINHRISDLEEKGD